MRVRVDEGNREITYDVAVDVQRAGQFGSRSVGGNGEETSVLVRALAERCREQGVTAGREGEQRRRWCDLGERAVQTRESNTRVGFPGHRVVGGEKVHAG